MSKKLKTLILLVIILPLALLLMFLIKQVQENLELEESSALFGGIREKGYPSAGFLVTNTATGSKSCGYSVLSNTLAITASHCVDDATSILLGKGNFTYENIGKKVVESAIQKSGWINGKTRSEDFAILRFADTGFFRDFAEIGTVTDGCNLRVVAYGRTENADEYGQFPRKSAKLCASEILAETFKVKGDPAENSGICFGDSGSPVYIEGTNQVVGVIVSIINKVPDDPNPCDFGNTAIVVRTDANLRLVNDTIEATSTNFQDISLDTSLQIEVAEETFLEKLGLNQLENLTETEKLTIALVATVVGVLAVIFITIKTLFKPKDKKISETELKELY